CGTGRNLIAAARRWPDARFYGIDISEAMLQTARAKVAKAGLSDRIVLAQGDATAFDAEALFGIATFDRIFQSYTLSMIPGWHDAIREAATKLA
ncbi:class I SAM-dependent methyltransferase, partial [Escherichia coli]|nr:class I SAM-dependent methyltransferase [Escherichia coli]